MHLIILPKYVYNVKVDLIYFNLKKYRWMLLAGKQVCFLMLKYSNTIFVDYGTHPYFLDHSKEILKFYYLI
jgi:hypothetical protein